MQAYPASSLRAMAAGSLKRSTTGGTVVFAAILVGALPVQARLNLPQSKQVVALPGETLRAIRDNVGSSIEAAGEIPASIRGDLLSTLPQDLRGACSALMEHWGTIAEGTDEWRVRILLRQTDQLWLAFRCASCAPDYGQHYDERLALLRLDAGKLEFFPLGPDADNDSTLYHLEFAEILPFEGAQGVAFKVTEPGENPCCDGPESRSGETWRVFADSPRGVRELLSITTARDDSSHSDEPETDSETTYRAELKLERDSSRRVTAITATFREEIKDITWDGAKSIPHTVSQRSGTLRYRWNPASLVFEEVK